MMYAQGVPGFITISREIRIFRAHYDSICQQYCDRVSQMSAEMDQKFAELPHRVASVLLDQFRIDGTTPITLDSMRRLISEMLVSNDGPLCQIRDSINLLRQQLMQPVGETAASDVTANNSMNRNAQAQVHMWPGGDGRLHRVPFGFKWPSYNTSTIWTLWHFGDLHRSIGPYKFISREHDLTLALCKVNYSRAKSIMKALTNLAIRDGRVRSAADINQQNHQEIYDYVMPLLMQELYIEPHERPIDLNINTLYNRMQRNSL